MTRPGYLPTRPWRWRPVWKSHPDTFVIQWGPGVLSIRRMRRAR